MFFGLFGGETRREKQLRLELNDLRNEVGELKAKQQGVPYYGSKYVDDYRTSNKPNKFSFTIEDLR